MDLRLYDGVHTVMTKCNFIDNERLREIRCATDWRSLFLTLQLKKDEQKSTEDDWWAISPFSPNEARASFHFNDKGWYCHSTGQGGGVVELVQNLKGCNCYEAGRWLLESGACSLQDQVRHRVSNTLSPAPAAPSDAGIKENKPIRQDLRRSLNPNHPAFQKRGTPPQVLQDLGIGHLKQSRGQLEGRLVFQIRGIERQEDGVLTPVILSHIGRSTTQEQESEGGKWHFYAGFRSSLEVYNLDKALLDDEAISQARETGHVLVVEGCFDVAKLWAAGVKNVVATFGSHLVDAQLPRFRLLSEELGIECFRIFFDRDQDGTTPNRYGAKSAVDILKREGYEADLFAWNHRYRHTRRGSVEIPEDIKDPCEFSVEQLQWLRRYGWI